MSKLIGPNGIVAATVVAGAATAPLVIQSKGESR